MNAGKTANADAEAKGFLEALGKRLRQVEQQFENRQEAARAAGVSKSTFQRWVEGKSDPSFQGLVTFAENAGLSLLWLARGRGPIEAAKLDILLDVTSGSGGYLLQSEPPPDALLDGGTAHVAVDESWRHAVVPRFDATRPTAADDVAARADVIDFFALPEAWVRHELGAEPANLVLLANLGDGMAPTVGPRDLVLVDLEHRQIAGDGLYVLARQGALAVKRIQLQLDGSIVVSGDNEAYGPQTVEARQATELNAVGRVRWVGKVF